MRRAILVALGTGAAISSAAAIGIGAALSPETPAMNRAEYESALVRIAQAGSAARARCESGEEPALCAAMARADERVRTANVEAAYRRTEAAARDAQRTRVQARYDVDRAKCEPLRGYRKDKCLIAAHATKGRALLEIAAPYGLRASD